MNINALPENTKMRIASTPAHPSYCAFNFFGKRSQYGFSLIEVLVSLVIISIGMLGVASLQLASMKGTQKSFMRHQATFLVQDIAERIRANPLNVNKYVFDTDLKRSFVCPAVKDCNVVSCNAIELVSFDKSTFACSLKKRISNARISITCDVATLTVPPGCANIDQENPIIIEVSWTERDLGKEKNNNNNVDGAGKGRTDNVLLQTAIMPKFKL